MFDGTDLSKWVQANGSPVKWKMLPDGSVEVVPGSGSALSRAKFGDCRVHVEFFCPGVPEAFPGQGKGNSGVYLQNAYEIQILESFGREPESHLCGGLYSIKRPDTNAEKPAKEWQAFDIDYKATQFSPDGHKTRNAFITVYLNGTLIHKDVEIPYPTADHMQPDPKPPGSIALQEHGVPVRFRNVWVQPGK